MKSGFHICRKAMMIFVFTCILSASLFAQFAGGLGTEADPYQVDNATHLNNVRLYPDKYFIQTADINLNTAPFNSGTGWQPIGSPEQPFSGIYSGDGHKILGLYIANPTASYQGLFGYTSSAEVYEISLEGATLTGFDYSGALIGCAEQTAISNCQAQGHINGGSVVGGLVGSLELGSSLFQCMANAIVQGVWSVGGLCGYNKGGGTIYQCKSLGQVVGNNAVGGLLGTQQGSQTTACYSRASVSGVWGLGGLVGVNDYQGNINGCFSTGLISGSHTTGGLVGRAILANAVSSYWDIQTSGQATSAGGDGRTTDQLCYPYDSSAFVGWEFGGIWSEDAAASINAGYPYLSWEYTPPEVIDLAVIAFSCPLYGNLGLPLSLSFNITNNGTNVASSYQIHLKDNLGNLLLSDTGASLDSGETRQVSLNWTPMAEGQISIYIQVQLLDDQVPGNDNSNVINITIFSQDHLTHYMEGTDLVRVPLDFYWRNSLYETIYTSTELGFVGNIHQLDFYNHFVSNLLNKPTRIWLGESSAGDLSAGWIPSTQLQLVFDGTVDYPGGSNTIPIVLQNPYNYQGANLVMLVQRPMDTDWFSTQDFFYGASTGAYNALQLISDTTVFDPAFPPSSGNLYPQKRPALTFHVAGSLQMLPPTDFSLNYTPGNDFVELSWAAPTGSSPSGYQIFRNGLLLASVSGATSFIDTGLTHGIAYYYQVAANYPAGTSNLTDSLAVTIYKKPLPADLVYPAQSASIESILPEFSWQASEGGGTFPQPDGYIFKLMDLSENQLLEEDVGNETSYQCPFSLNWNSGYLWQIFPYIVLPGSTQLINTDSPTWSFYTQEIMGQPVNLQATVLDWQDVQLTWTMDRSGEPDAGKDSSLSSALSAGQRELQQFNIYRNGLYLDNCNETSYSDAGLADGYYEYYVIAIYESGESAPSDTAEVNINTVYPVQDLQADILGDVVQISWNPSLPGLEESYQIFRLGYGSEDYPELWTLLATGIQNHLYQDTEWGILPDGSYRWAVVAEYTGGTMAETIFSNPLQKNNPFPIISVNPGLIEYSISDTDTLHLQLTIANSGSADLIWDSQLVYERTGQNRNLNIYLDPSSGMIEPGSQQLCSLVIAPIYSVLGMNNYELCINSNDPVSSTTIIPINITVNSTPANIPDANFRIAINDALGQGEEYQPTIADLNGMSGMLEAYDRGITSIEGAQYLTNMDGLKLDTNQISDLTELGSLNNLSYLSLTNNQITDISPLANLHNLTTLQFSINQVADISPLTQLTALNTLYIGQNQISELSPLSGLVNLQSLDLSFNVINDISAISNLGNLTSFSAVNNQISNVSPLALLLNLQHVQLNLNQISDISALSGLVNLLYLDLNYNPVSDIAPLTNLVNLQNLYLKSSQVSDLSPLSGLHSLGTLYLGFSQINNINSLSSLVNLAYLDLEYNQISDLSALANLINLDLLTLEGNPLSKESMLLTQSWSLPYVATTYNPISPCYPFPARDQTDISLSSVLSWSGNYNGDTSSFEVWAGFTPSALELNGSVAATADTLYGYSLPLTAYTNYYWRIKAIGSTETIWSGMWHFSTVGDVSGNVDRNLVVVEIGEGTWCQYCVGSAIGAQELLANDHPVAIINNHISDSFTNTYSNARNSYYNISGYPTAFFDGLNSSVGGSASVSMYSTYLPRVNSRIAIQSSYGISASGTFDDNILSLSALVAKPGAGTYNNVVLHCVITESNLDYNWFSQTQVHSVNRLMVPDQNGTPISLNTGQWTTIPLNIVIDNAWDLSNCEVVLFLQNTTSKEIIQGAKYPLTEFIEIPNPPSNVLAVDNGTSVNVSWNSPSGTTPQNYAVYRLLSGQEADESVWTLLAPSIIDSFYVDSGWYDLLPGAYKWAVKANLSGTISSDATISNEIVKASGFAGGSGTEADPYQVATAKHLNNVRNYLDAHYIQIANINLDFPSWNEGAGWLPIGDDSNPFTGVYNGNSYLVSDIYINRSEVDFQGLFGVIQFAQIHHLSVIRANVSAYNWSGIIVGRAYDSNIANCTSDGFITGEGGSIGHLAGRLDYSQISNCQSFGDLYGAGYSVGGMVGRLDGSQMSNCYAQCYVWGGGYLGGLAGFTLNGSSISASFGNGSVSASENYVGGVTGYCQNSTISSCFSRSSISGNEYIGGLVGITLGTAITDCYSVGEVSGLLYTGGLIGFNAGSSTADFSYWNTEISGISVSALGEGRTTAEMTYPYAANTYAGWDWVEIWGGDISFEINNGYPYLQWYASAPLYYPPRFVQAGMDLDAARIMWNSPLSGQPDSYQVWRLLPYQESDEAMWTLVSGAVTDTLVMDPQWQYLTEGTYKWAVKARYGTELSIAEFSNQMFKEVLDPYINVTPASVYGNPVSGTTFTAEVRIDNTGEAALIWSATLYETYRSATNSPSGRSARISSAQSNSQQRDISTNFYPSSGSIAPYGFETIQFEFDTTDTLAPQTFTYNLEISSNAANSTLWTVPITIDVQPLIPTPNSAPVVSNVQASQRDDASMMMDIYYDVYDADYDSLTISLKVSADDGATWNVACTMIQSGSDIGNQIYSGTGKHIVWDVASEHPNILGNSFRFKVIADDQKAMPIPANFVQVEGGTFNNGTSDVTLSSFYIDKYELTQADYQAVMGTNPSYFAGNPNRPVEQVSWFNAIEYCNRRSIIEGLIPCYSYLSYGTNPDNWPTGWNATNANHTDVNCNWSVSGYRLPTEAEWEFAARGGNLSMGYTYSGSNNVNDVAWWGYGWGGTSGSATNEVGTIGANELHLFDFSGNVFEWVWDIMGEYPSIPQSNPTGSLVGTNRVSRGGNWGNPEYYCQVAYRYNYVPISSSLGQGFRICRRIVLGTVSTPVFSPMPGVYTTAQSVTISCTTPGATIRYTLDGSEPTEMSSIYVGPILVSVDTTIKAIAYKDAWLPSPISAATYTIQSSMPANFVFVEGGTFNPTDSYGNPTDYYVTLSSFYIDKYELTQADYQAVMGVNPSATGFWIGPSYPIYNVSWFNAIEYCNRRSFQEGLIPCYSYSTFGTNPDTWPVDWNSNSSNHTNVSCNWTANGYRLPTEMEWFFSASGGNQTHNYIYSGSNSDWGVANFMFWQWVDDPAFAWPESRLLPVGSLAANELGTYDMSGNVQEWTWDIYGGYPSGSQNNPTGANNGSIRVLRGGSCYMWEVEGHVSNRNADSPTHSAFDTGFRCVRVSP